MVDDIKRADPTGDIDVSGFVTVPRKPLPPEGRSVAEGLGFQSREYKRPRRKRTGRSAQLGLKVTPAAAELFTALADAERMGFGEFLEHMLGVYAASHNRVEPKER
jgi:hypothetical protein